MDCIDEGGFDGQEIGAGGRHWLHHDLVGRTVVVHVRLPLKSTPTVVVLQCSIEENHSRVKIGFLWIRRAPRWRLRGEAECSVEITLSKSPIQRGT